MKKIKFLIFFLVISSCNRYLGTVDPDYTPSNEVSEIFSNIQKDTNNTSIVDFGDIIFPNSISISLSSKNLEIEKIINTDRNSVINFLYDRIILSKNKNIYIIDNKNENNNLEYKINLNKDEIIHHIFGYNDNFYILTNTSRIFAIDEQNIINIADYDIFTNTSPIILDESIIIFSVFGDIYEIKFNDFSISKKVSFKSKPGITFKSNLFEDKANLYYLFNTGTLVTFGKNNFEYYNNYIIEDLNILSTLGVFNELLDSPFSYNNYLYFLDRSGKIAVYNPVSSDILWELDINDTIISYLFSNDGYLILLTLEKILIISNDGSITYEYFHNNKSPLSILNIQENIHLISEEGITKLNLNDRNDNKFYKNKFTSNLEIYFQDQNIYFKDDNSLFKLSE